MEPVVIQNGFLTWEMNKINNSTVIKLIGLRKLFLSEFAVVFLSETRGWKNLSR